MFTIEKGIPICRSSYHSGTSEALRKLEVGDSFLYPIKKRYSIDTIARRLGIAITIRKIDKDTVRIWRTQ